MNFGKVAAAEFLQSLVVLHRCCFARETSWGLHTSECQSTTYCSSLSAQGIFIVLSSVYARTLRIQSTDEVTKGHIRDWDCITTAFPYSVALCESRAASNPSACPYAVADNTARLVFAKALAFPKAAHDDDNDDNTLHVVIATLHADKQTSFRLSR